MPNVLSFDPDRIEMSVTPDGRMTVKKSTCSKEYRNILSAHKHLNKHPMGIEFAPHGTIHVQVAELCGWDETWGTLSTLLHTGKNLEVMLRESIGTERHSMLHLIGGMLNTFRTHGFLWGDFAPRNMIWSESENIIWLVDFERDLELRDCPINASAFARYARNYSREEFSCFMTKQESCDLFKDIIKDDISGYMPTNLIASKRKRALLKTLYGEKSCYSMDNLREAEDLMVFIATPFRIHSTYFFPIEPLDLISAKRGPHGYSSTVMAIKDLGESDRFNKLVHQVRSL